jgi:hypothetical protein
MSYQEACAALGQTTQNFKKTFLSEKIIWAPRAATVPNETWRKKGEAITFSTFKFLMSAAGRPHRKYLHDRGISIDTIKAARLGFVDTAMTFDPTTWGLPETNKNIWIPRGIIIPYFHQENGLLRLRIRQDQPISSDRYILVAGSSTDYFSYPNPNASYDQDKPVYITEAEIDGWLCWQEFGDQANIKAIGNSSTRPDQKTHDAMVDADTILLGLDNDPAGQKESGWWKKQYSNTQICTVPKGKDPGEAFEQGVDLKQWFASQLIDKGLITETPEPQPEPERPQSPPDSPTQLEPDIVDTAIEPPKKICLHNQYCSFLKNSTCLVVKKDISNLNQCPKNKWWLHQTEYDHISQIILGVGVRSRNK